MQFTHRQLGEVAKRIGISERAVERLLGNTAVEVRKKIDFESVNLATAAIAGVERFQLGVRLQGDTPLVWSTELAAECVHVLEEYRNLCPHCFNWLCSATFDSRKSPEGVTRANILHASRTASRLRSRLMRKFQLRIGGSHDF